LFFEPYLAALELYSRKWKEECMNHGRGERTDHLPIFDPSKLYIPEEWDTD
jgi:hypothetical protein